MTESMRNAGFLVRAGLKLLLLAPVMLASLPQAVPAESDWLPVERVEELQPWVKPPSPEFRAGLYFQTISLQGRESKANAFLHSMWGEHFMEWSRREGNQRELHFAYAFDGTNWLRVDLRGPDEQLTWQQLNSDTSWRRWRLLVQHGARRAYAWEADAIVPVQKHDGRSPWFFEYRFDDESLAKSETTTLNQMAGQPKSPLLYQTEFRQRLRMPDLTALAIDRVQVRKREGQLECVASVVSQHSRGVYTVQLARVAGELVPTSSLLVSSATTDGGTLFQVSHSAFEDWSGETGVLFPHLQRVRGVTFRGEPPTASELPALMEGLQVDQGTSASPEAALAVATAAELLLAASGDEDTYELREFRPEPLKPLQPLNRPKRYLLHERVGIPARGDFEDGTVSLHDGFK